MSICWQIVELKEPKKDIVDLSVSRAPVKWIEKRGDEFFCLWPDTFEAQKIISAADPKPGETWRWYSCRILMNGAKFTDHKEALEAEQICMNVSTVSAFERQSKKVKLSDTYQQLKMKDNDESDVEMDFSSDDNYLSGNDSFDFNKKMLFNCWWNEEVSGEESRRFVDVENLDSSKPIRTELSVWDADETSQEKNYIDFKSEITNLLTSSGVSEHSDPETTSNLLTRIGKLQTLLIGFTSDVQRELNELKKIAVSGNCIISDDQSSTAGSNRENLKEFDENLQTPVLLERSTSINTSYVETNVTLQDDEIISLDNDTVNMESTYLISAQDMPIVLNTTEPLQNATVIFEKYDNLLEPMMNGTIKLPVVSGDNLASKILVASGDNIASKIIDDATIGSSNSQDSVKDNAMESLILPITSEPHFKHVEELLYIDANADDFIKLTLPKENETESKYMDRIFRLLFEENFFLNFVSWRKEKNRIDMRGTNILYHWKESFATKFESVENAKFIIHCRRLKSAIRAAKPKNR